MENKLLSWLDPNRNLAKQRLGKIQQMLFSKFNSKWYLSNEDVKDCVQETIKRVIQNLENERLAPDSVPEAYFCGVAENVLKEKRDEKRRDSSKRIEIDMLEQSPDPNTSDFEDHILTKIEQEQILRCLKKSIRKLKPQEHELIKLYSESESHYTNELMDLFGKSPNALRIQIYRTMRKLQRWIEKCLENQSVYLK